jgi:hypothetical protein
LTQLCNSLRAVAIAALTMAAGIALGDDNPAPANPTPRRRHNNPAWVKLNIGTNGVVSL